MPNFNVKTVSANEVWKAPDGKMSIYELVLDHNGKAVKAKTYSKTIAQIGWSGTVESYEKPGRNGNETFVKQPQKEGGYQGKSKPQGDSFTMYLSYAKDLAVACIKDGKFDSNLYGEALENVVTGGKTLYEARPDAPKPDQTPVHDDMDAPVDLQELNSIFEGAEQISGDEPWLKNE